MYKIIWFLLLLSAAVTLYYSFFEPSRIYVG